MATLAHLPNEILSLVTSHLEHPRDVANLSSANRRLRQFVQLDGWNAYLKGRFGFARRRSDARHTVHGLATLHRNWERKALVSRYLIPSSTTRSLNTWEEVPWTRQHGQTMGYRPSIDSYEEHGRWSDRREVLTWSAGTRIVIRTRETGSRATNVWDADKERDALDAHKHLTSWYTYQIPEGTEGLDDITALKLLRPHQKNDESDYVALGSASGSLSLLQIDVKGEQMRRQHFHTQRRAVTSLSISPNPTPKMVATVDNSALVLYDIDTEFEEGQRQQPVDEIRDFDRLGNPTGRIWSCNFLSDDTIAVGLGPTSEPIQILRITSSGFSSEPVRTFKLDYSRPMNTSVYPIVPLPHGSRAGGEGSTFLSGAYDGIVRLHDMRSPREFETMLWDVTNDSSIYSLTTQGLDHVVAGSSMHSMLKVFDLRVSGSLAYKPIPVAPKPRFAKSNSKTGDYAGNSIARDAIDCSGATPVTGGWNLYLHPRNQPAQRHPRSQSRYDSPIYSLSIPSATSPSLFAGVEGSVIGIDFHSVTDTHPDPIFSSAIVNQHDSTLMDVKRSYNINGDALNLGMYEQGNEQSLGMRLMVQGDVDNTLFENKVKRNHALFDGLDERWKDPSDEGSRWTRGQQPRGQQPQGRGGRGGRGRGRGRGPRVH